MTGKVPDSKSEWDGREKFFDQWDEDRGAIRTALIMEDYHAALDYLSTWIVNFSGYVDLDISLVRNEITGLLADINSNERFDDEVFRERGAELRLELKNRFYYYMAVLTRVMNKLRMLVPITELMVMDDPDHVADNYERLVYGEVCGDKDKGIVELGVYDESYPWIDDNLKGIITRQRWLNEKKNKDSLWILFGSPGAGKSTLAHHCHDFYTGGTPLIGNVAFDKDDFSIVIDTSLSSPLVKNRVTHYDEANVSKREAMTNWNKDIIDLYDSIRGENGFHLWCNPSAQYLDTKFIAERVNAIIYVYEGTGRTRRFALIPRKKVIEFLEKKDNLKTGTMDKHAKDFAVDFGWFKVYDNKEFLALYDGKKTARMKLKRERFRERWGNEEETGLSLNRLAADNGADPATIKKYVQQLGVEGKIDLASIRGSTGFYRFTPEQASLVVEAMKVRVLEKKRGRRRLVEELPVKEVVPVGDR